MSIVVTTGHHVVAHELAGDAASADMDLSPATIELESGASPRS
jgi:hypothetical protein